MTIATGLNELTRHLGVPSGSIQRGRGIGYVLMIHCKACGRFREFGTTKGHQPPVMAKKIVARGWNLKPLLCPEHAKAAKAAKPKGEEKMPQPKPTDPTNAAKAAQRNVLRWLDEAFNSEAGTYAAGISDATIAAETGVSKEKVAQLREDFHGPLKAPSEWESMWRGLDQIANRVDDFEREAAAVVKQARDDLAAFKAQMTRAAQNGGWKI